MKKYIFALFIGGLFCQEQIVAQDLKSNLVFDMQVDLGPLQVVDPVLKAPHPEFRSLGNISGAQLLPKGPIFFIIDDSLIRDTANVRIEAANIFQVRTVSSAQIGYFPTGAPPVSIVLVETYASFHKQEPQPGIIHLR
jgi:hypothetical protein